jgi:hypothetical protein
MRRARAAWFSVRRWLPALVFVFVASVALADDRIAFLAERLRTADDFRVRASAALALGNTNDDAAVPPLCVGIDDSSDIVRKAVALALGRLMRSSGLVCLRRRSSVEKDASVKQQIDRAIDQIQAGGGGAPVANAKYYVSLSPVSNGSSRPQADVDRVIQGAIKAKLSQIGGYEIAPAGESPAAAKDTISKRGLKGFYLSIKLDKLEYDDGGLHVKIRMAVSTYPGKDLQGDMSKGGGIAGVHPGDTSSEDQLMTAVASSAAESFAQAFH